MAKGKTPKSWAEQIANLNDPAPRGIVVKSAPAINVYNLPDHDPEEHVEQFDDREDSKSVDSEEGAATAREHYIDVGYGYKRYG